MYDAKGIDVVILDVGDITLIADFFVIASGSNTRHVQLLADRVVYSEEIARKPMHVEGYGLGYWVLLDYGDVVVHVFREEERDFYGLKGCGATHPGLILKKISVPATLPKP